MVPSGSASWYVGPSSVSNRKWRWPPCCVTRSLSYWPDASWVSLMVFWGLQAAAGVDMLPTTIATTGRAKSMRRLGPAVAKLGIDDLMLDRVTGVAAGE